MDQLDIRRQVQRKGYNRRLDIPPKILRALNTGVEEPRTLAEWLAIDAIKLLKSILPSVGLENHSTRIIKQARPVATKGVMERQKMIGKILFDITGDLPESRAIFHALASHPSGVVREWAALMITANPNLSIEKRIREAKRFAADPSMNVREIAWMSYRPFLTDDWERGLQALAKWVRDEDPNIRRCAVESTRPRGVWCSHIKALRTDPSLGLPLLEPVRSDTSKYVQLSVGNWLNDASKDNPRWAQTVCRRWRKESPTDETKRIVNRGLRTIRSEQIT